MLTVSVSFCIALCRTSTLTTNTRIKPAHFVIHPNVVTWKLWGKDWKKGKITEDGRREKWESELWEDWQVEELARQKAVIPPRKHRGRAENRFGVNLHFKPSRLPGCGARNLLICTLLLSCLAFYLISSLSPFFTIFLIYCSLYFSSDRLDFWSFSLSFPFPFFFFLIYNYLLSLLLSLSQGLNSIICS